VIDLPSAQPAAISSLSPTAANDLLACPYRLAWRLDPRFRSLRRPSAWSSLGVVAHAVAEDVAKGLLAEAETPDDARALIESSWAKHEADAHLQLIQRWAPAMPPGPTEWPGYHLTRARTIRRALRLFGAPRLSTSSPTTTIVETDLAAADTGLMGRPDRVEGGPGDRCVVDLKTGLSQEGATESQRLQLLIYCHLVDAVFGDVPTRIAIEDPSGRRWEEAVTPADVDEVVAHIQDARRKYEGTPTAELATMATPSADTCRRCTYRLVCTPYWEALETTWEHASVAGTVVDIRSNAQAATVRIDAVSPIDAPGDGWLLTAVPPTAPLDVGAATAVDAELTGGHRHLRWRWSTLMWKPGPP
jgi:CRISPR/Cas system-associated exonuclease Cas4 (RecB family)